MKQDWLTTQTHIRHASRAPRAGGARRFSAWIDRHFKWLMVAPAVLLILALSIYPLLFSLWVAFVNYDFQIPGHAFVGLKNFTQVIADPGALGARWSDDRACRSPMSPSSSCSASRWRSPW